MDTEKPAAVADTEGRLMLAVAQTDWARHVPHCPDWDAAGLIRHIGGIAWMSAVISSGQRVSRRDLDPAPTTYVSPAASSAARSSK